MDRIIKKKKWTPKKIATILGSSLLAFFIIYLIFLRDSSSRLYIDRDRVTIAEVTQGSFQEFIPVDGVVQPIVTIYVDAVLGGRVEEIFIRDGAMVKEGDEILRLSNASVEMDYMYRENNIYDVLNNYQNTQLAMEQNKFNLERQIVELEYQLDISKRDYERKKQFYKENVISVEEYENSEREYKYLLKRLDIAKRTLEHDSLYSATQMAHIKESIERMQHNLKLVNKNLENLTIRAPISGRLSSFNVERGETKNTGENIGQIDDIDGYKLRARIDERYLNRTFIGQNAGFEYGGEKYQLEISKIYSTITSGAFEVDLNFKGEEPNGLRRGQTLQLRLQFSGVADAIKIPRGGFYQETGGNWIYIVDASGNQAIKRNIRIGRQNIHHYEVLEGLEPGEKVIVSSYDAFGGKDRLIFR